ncbi:MAG: molybdopterin-dependent oxidoreductase [Fibrobacteria bacterium]
MESQEPENPEPKTNGADAANDSVDAPEAADPAFNQALIRGKMRIAAKGHAKDLEKDQAMRLMAGGRAADEAEVQGTGPANRHGMPQLPPGQHEVKNWPVLDLGVQPAIPRDMWSLTVKGYVEQPYVLEWKDFMALPQVEDVSDFHCVTSWSRMDNHWTGVRFRTLAEKAILKKNATHVHIKAYDGYSTNLPISECLDDDVLLVHGWEGIDLPREHGGPVRMITPRKYAWKGAKWIKEILFIPQDLLGFWELRGYSNTAEPWFNDRYS